MIFALRGQHPDLGAVTLSQLLSTWAVHDLTHLHQISRTMAHQYREAVGPWIKYLGVHAVRGPQREGLITIISLNPDQLLLHPSRCHRALRRCDHVQLAANPEMP